MLSLKKIRKAVSESQDMINALEAYDRSGRLSKIGYKERVNFTIDEDTINEFRRYCRRRGISMSNIIEELIRGRLKCK